MRKRKKRKKRRRRNKYGVPCDFWAFFFLSLVKVLEAVGLQAGGQYLVAGYYRGGSNKTGRADRICKPGHLVIFFPPREADVCGLMENQWVSDWGFFFFVFLVRSYLIMNWSDLECECLSLSSSE